MSLSPLTSPSERLDVFPDLWMAVSHRCCVKVGPFGMVVVVLLAWISWARPAGVSAQVAACPANSGGMSGATTLDGVFEVEEQGGTLGPFLSSAESTRRVIMDGELPYDAIRKEIFTASCSPGLQPH